MQELTKVFKALSDNNRLKIFMFLSRKTLCVNALVNCLGISQPAVSQHLRVLREANLIKAEKRGYWVHYSANKEKARQFIKKFNDLLGGDIPIEDLPVFQRIKRDKAFNDAQIKNIFKRIYSLLAKQIVDDYKITKGICLDIGSGAGQLGIELAKLTSLKVYLFDIDTKVIAAASKNIRLAGISNRVSSLQGNVQQMPFVDNIADLIVSRGSIFFWDDRPRGFREIYRVLKPGGIAFIGGGVSRYLSQYEREIFIKWRETGLEKEDEKKKKEWHKLRSPDYFYQLLKDAGIPNFKIIPDLPGIWAEIRK